MCKKILSFALILLCLSSFTFAQNLSAKAVTAEAEKKENTDQSIAYLKETVGKITDPAEKRAVYIFLGSLQEQLSMYDEAQKSYAAAAGIGSTDAKDMPVKSNEELVLDAVRCALSSGDYTTADSYLNSAVRNSRKEDIQAKIKLYTQWSALCKAETVEDLQEPIVMLQAYEKVDSMKSVRPSILITLWYVTGNKAYSDRILSLYPLSVEAEIVKGDVQLLPTPFWFFVPKQGEAEAGTGTFETSDESEKTEIKAENAKQVQTKENAAAEEKAKTENSASEKSAKLSKLQLGLFRTESNAKLLQDELKTKGFDAYVESEKRASGTTYYIVLVNDNKEGTMADKLRSSGYECYMVE